MNFGKGWNDLSPDEQQAWLKAHPIKAVIVTGAAAVLTVIAGVLAFFGVVVAVVVLLKLAAKVTLWAWGLV